MGPRHEGRGRRRPGRCTTRDQGRFNGATPREAWETPAGPARRRAGVWGFNGATPRGAWKTDRDGGQWWIGAALQWGHATRGVEDIECIAAMERQQLASMGPRHEGR